MSHVCPTCGRKWPQETVCAGWAGHTPVWTIAPPQPHKSQAMAEALLHGHSVAPQQEEAL